MNDSLQKLLIELEKLPGIGPKSAQRIAYWILNTDTRNTNNLADTIKEVKSKVHFCDICYNYTTDDICPICSDKSRDKSILCVVSEPKNISLIENSNSYNGLFHVLGGEISPMDGIGPEQLNIKELISRLNNQDIKEVILATNTSIEGETTASYLSRLIKPLSLKVTRLASGIPMGGEIEYTDEITLAKAIENRIEI